MARRTAVIGAGPAGCYAAHLLQQQGREVVLYEQAKSVGGRTTSWHDQGWVVDSGAGFFTNFYPTLWGLITKLGLEGEITNLSRSNALTDGEKVADFTLGSTASFANFTFLGTRAKLSMAMQTALIFAKYRHLDLSSAASLAPFDDASVRDDAVKRVGERAYQYLVRPGIEPFWFFSCESISRSLMLALQAKAATARFYTFRQGMNFVCTKLAANLDVRTGVTVDHIKPSGAKFKITGATLADGPEHIYDEVIVATTGSVAAKITAGLDERIVPDTVRSFLKSQTYVPNTHLVFVIDKGVKLPKMSCLLPCGPKDHRVAGLNFNSHKLQTRGEARSGQEAISVYLTAEESKATLGMSERDLYTHAWRLARELSPDLPLRAEPLQMIQRREAIPIHAVGRYRAAAEVGKQQKGPLVFAGDYLSTATVDGAMRTGYEAAHALDQRVTI